MLPLSQQACVLHVAPPDFDESQHYGTADCPRVRVQASGSCHSPGPQRQSRSRRLQRVRQ